MTNTPNKDKSAIYVMGGLSLMVLAALLFIFIDNLGEKVIGLIVLFMVGFGCCVAGTDTSEYERKKMERELDEKGPF